MALSYPLRGYAGGASAGATDTALPSTKTTGSFSSSATLTGWADVTGNNFTSEYLCLSFGYGTASEEKILVTFNNANTFTIQSRGYDGTTPQNWDVGSAFVLVATASELAEANDAVQVLKTILTNSGTTTAPQPIAYSSTTAGSAGTGQTPAAIDHSHNISASTLNSWLVGGASGTVGSGVVVPATQVGAGTLPSGVTASKTWSASNTTAITGITGYNTYIILIKSQCSYTGAAGNFTMSATANGVTGLGAIGLNMTVASTSYALASFAIAAIGNPSTVFSAQLVRASAAGTPSFSNDSIIVIGIN
jgi:hypothetical protein